MQQRFARIEASVISSRLAALPEDAVHPLGIVMTQDSSGPNTLQKIFRRQQAAQRDWYKAVEALERIQTVRRRAEAQAITAAPSTASYPNRVRFDVPALPAARPAAEAPVNLALRL
jgi:hypothetical protein